MQYLDLQTADELPRVVITAPRRSQPLSAQRKLAELARPTDDAAQLLADTPGVAVMRQAGTAGAAVLRGLGTARLPVVVDGQALEGACNHGMDPATSYVDAAAMDKLTVVKGPHSVKAGLALGGSVQFERSSPDAEAPSSARIEATLGSFGRRGAAVRGIVNTAPAFVRVDASHAQADDYRSPGAAGGSVAVPSAFERHATALSTGWRITPQTLWTAELSESDGQARYPSYHMDGTHFRRTQQGTRLRMSGLGELLQRLEIRAGWYGTAHAMDDYSLRPPHEEITNSPPLLLVQRSTLAMDQALRGRSAGIEAELAWGGGLLTLGHDLADNRYQAGNRFWSETCTSLFGSTTCSQSRASLPYYDLAMRRRGVYAQWAGSLGQATLLTLGWRQERWHTQTGGLYAFSSVTPATPLPGSGQARSEHPRSAFARLEHNWSIGLSTFAAAGHAQRPADYVERAIFGAASTPAERNTELDLGANYRDETWRAAATLYRSRVLGFIQTYQGSAHETVDATREGGEAELGWRPTAQLDLGAALAWLHARNDTRHTPLAQTPPPELRLQARHTQGPWSWTLAARLVAAQQRTDPGYGNTVGQDVSTRTAGFSLWSAHTRWQWRTGKWLSAGVDNLFDRRYVEHINHSIDQAQAGLAVAQRVPEPGRAWWLKLHAEID